MEKYVKFNLDESKIMNQISKWLADSEFVPEDIFEKSSFSEPIKYYLPMFLFQGKYKAKWEISVPEREDEIYKEYDSSQKKYVTKSRELVRMVTIKGKVKNRFNIFCFAGEMNNFNEEFLNKGEDLIFNEIQVSEIDDLESIQLIPFSKPEKICWEESGEEQVGNLAYLLAELSISYSEYENLNVYPEFEVENVEKYYLPFYLVNYKYKEDSYQVILRGDNISIIYGVPPKDNELADFFLRLSYVYYSLIFLFFLWVFYGVYRAFAESDYFFDTSHSNYSLNNLLTAPIGSNIWIYKLFFFIFSIIGSYTIISDYKIKFIEKSKLIRLEKLSKYFEKKPLTMNFFDNGGTNQNTFKIFIKSKVFYMISSFFIILNLYLLLDFYTVRSNLKQNYEDIKMVKKMEIEKFNENERKVAQEIDSLQQLLRKSK